MQTESFDNVINIVKQTCLRLPVNSTIIFSINPPMQEVYLACKLPNNTNKKIAVKYYSNKPLLISIESDISYSCDSSVLHTKLQDELAIILQTGPTAIPNDKFLKGIDITHDMFKRLVRNSTMSKEIKITFYLELDNQIVSLGVSNNAHDMSYDARIVLRYNQDTLYLAGRPVSDVASLSRSLQAKFAPFLQGVPMPKGEPLRSNESDAIWSTICRISTIIERKLASDYESD